MKAATHIYAKMGAFLIHLHMWKYPCLLGAVKYKTVSMHDHNFSKHPLNEDFFHVKMTPWNKDFSMLNFSLDIWPLKEDFFALFYF